MQTFLTNKEDLFSAMTRKLLKKYYDTNYTILATEYLEQTLTKFEDEYYIYPELIESKDIFTTTKFKSAITYARGLLETYRQEKVNIQHIAIVESLKLKEQYITATRELVKPQRVIIPPHINHYYEERMLEGNYDAVISDGLVIPIGQFAETIRLANKN